jgi:hypothetical protein
LAKTLEYIPPHQPLIGRWRCVQAETTEADFKELTDWMKEVLGDQV